MAVTKTSNMGKPNGNLGVDSKTGPTKKMKKESDLPPWRLLFCLFGISMLSLATFGFQEVSLNVPGHLLQHYLNESIVYDFNVVINSISLSSLWGGIMAMMPIGAVFGAASAGCLADRIGRKPCLFGIANIASLIGAGLLFLSHHKILFELLMIGRLISGYAVGLTTTVLPMYLIESSPTKNRGLIGTFTAICVNILMTLSFVLSLPMFLGTIKNWGYLLGLQAIPSLLMLILYPFLPETPCFSLIRRGDRRKAVNTIYQLYGSISDQDVDALLETFEHEGQLAQEKTRIREFIYDTNLLKAAFVAVLIGAMRSMCGAPVVHSYSTSMFEKVGVHEKVAEYGSLIFGLGVITSLISSVLADKLGRRPIYLICLGLIIVSWLAVFILSNFVRVTQVPWVAWINLGVILFTFVIIYPLGPGAMSWYLAAELVPVNARATVTSLCIISLWLSMLVVVSIYPVLVETLGTSAILLQFVAPLLIGLLLLMIMLPETKHVQTQKNLKQMSRLDLTSNSDESELAEISNQTNYGSLMNKDD